MKVISLVKTLSFLQKYNACFLIIIDLLVFLLFCFAEIRKDNLFLFDHSLLKWLVQLKHCSFQSFDNLVVLVENEYFPN